MTDIKRDAAGTVLYGYADWNNPTVEEIRANVKAGNYHCGDNGLNAYPAFNVLFKERDALQARVAALEAGLKTFGEHRRGCPHPSCPDCGTHTMAASKTPGYSYCTRCGRGSIPTSNEACDCGFEALLAAAAPQHGGRPMTLRECMEAEEP